MTALPQKEQPRVRLLLGQRRSVEARLARGKELEECTGRPGYRFLYQPLVDIVEADEIDFCQPSEEKWGFAVELLTVLAETIRGIPDAVFQKNGFQREEVLFFATMSDGDYIQDMLDQSVRLFNSEQTQKAFGLAQ